MYRFEIIDQSQPEWNKVVKSSNVYDFHHTSFYHSIDNTFNSKLFVAYNDQEFIALPMVIRPIGETGLFDCTSVYGYAGPITSREDFNFDPEFSSFFKKSFNAYCEEKGIVSAFSRLHPLIEHSSFFEDFGKVIDINKTITIDLTLPSEQQRAQYRKSNKSEINQLKRKGFYVAEAQNQNDIDAFVSIYYETMERVNASPGYFFTKEYFNSFLNNDNFDSKLLLAKYNEEVTAGAIFTMTKKIMQYHLAGTTEQYIRETPMKLILDEARLLGNEAGMESLHLGGGVGGSDEDSLFRFKSGFSNKQCEFKVWQYIINQKKYNELSEKISDKNNSFFPLYRSE
ncbi:GNAT family N-acetyltransferase [Chryseobacterium indologenes]|uniref:GNAT family N-acetyltransferase n=2 Tax=Chryseobacterium TaxID=59732 RepID=UPI0023E789E3|nr:GNAT family N-acetyltransferase [Chryseobacterium indologenes]WET51519.1 GNAT family N-acetyltransferase [Chryseobacterium indologenes]